ncbi:MAG: pilus assembly protein N-terminal domain-containing protein [Pseudomonadota bacterium]
MRSIVISAAAAALLAPLSGPSLAGEHALRINSSDGTIMTTGQDVGSVVVADPAIADLQVLSDRKLFLFGKTPGTTRLFVLNAQDEIILERRLVVTPSLDRIDKTFATAAPPTS